MAEENCVKTKKTMISYCGKNLFSFSHHQTVKTVGTVVFSVLWILSWIKRTASGELLTWETGEYIAYEIFFFINSCPVRASLIVVRQVEHNLAELLAGIGSTPLWGGLFSALK
jgi:hypothetical protein